MTRRHVFIGLCVAAALAVLIGAWSLRLPFIKAAEADLKTRGFYWSSVLGTRIPCSGAFDIGVSVVFQTTPNGETIGGRLCRPPDRSSAWTWHPDPARVRP
jgi:hypothetical protein